MNYKDYFKQQLINEMAMTGRAYDSAVGGWKSRGRKTREGMNILRQIHSPHIYDLDDSGDIMDTGDDIPANMSQHGLMGGYARDRQSEARLGRRVQRAGRDAYYDRGDLNAFHDQMAKINPEDSEEIMNLMNKYPEGIVGGLGRNNREKRPSAGWRMDPTKGRYRFKPKNIGGVGGDPLFSAFS